MKNFLHHLFLPRESNNHRPKILHHQSLLFVIAALLFGQFLISFAKTNYVNVLGVTTDISSQDLLLLINQKRQEKGLIPLALNEKLSLAALNKAKDMFAKNYWSHNSPNGTTPWFFIQKSGYEYNYAGENLARGFTNSEDVVNAWMASATHKENLLSANYKEVGFAIVKGKLLGEETTLVVEMLGSSVSPELARTTEVKEEASYIAGWQSNAENSFINFKPMIDSRIVSWDIAIILLFLFIFVFILDMVIVERRKIIRFVGHNLDHTFFLIEVLVLLAIFGRGSIL